MVRPILEVIRRPLARLGIDNVDEASALDLDFQRPLEGHRIVDVPTVGGDPSLFALRLADRRAHSQVAREPQIPRVIEVVFRPRAHQRRLLLAIHVESIIRLAKPAPDRVLRREDRPHVLSLALAVEDGVDGERLRRILLPVSRVEVQRVLRERLQLQPLALEVDGHPLGALVVHLDAAVLAEGHSPVAVQRAPVAADLDGERGDIRLHPVPGGEEVADGALNRWDG